MSNSNKRNNTSAQSLKMTERRSEDRPTAVFRPCGVLHDKRAQIGTIRNVSYGGAQIQTCLALQDGDRISYYWDGVDNLLAEVAWAKDDIYGLRNISNPHSIVGDYPRRSVRIPCAGSAFVWSGVGMQTLEIANISMSGMLVAGVEDITSGSLFTVKLGRVSLPNCTIRRMVDNMVGVRFGRMLSMKELSIFLSHCEDIRNSSEPVKTSAPRDFFGLSISPNKEPASTAA